MLNFDLKKTQFPAIFRWMKFPLFGLAGFFKKTCLVFFILFLVIFLYGFLSSRFSEGTSQFLLGWAILFITLFFVFWKIQFFFNSKVKKLDPDLKISKDVLESDQYNLAKFLSLPASQAVRGALRRAKRRPVSSTHLLYGLISDKKEINFVFNRLLVGKKEVKKRIKQCLKTAEVAETGEGYRKNFEAAIIRAAEIAVKKNHSRIGVGDLLVALAEEDPVLERILIDFNLRVEDVENLTWWWEDVQEEIAENKRFWEYKNLVKRGTLAKEWTAGYTITLDRFSRDITEMVRRSNFKKVGHQEEISSMERILSRREMNNVLLVGQPGSGRKSIVFALAQKSLMGESAPEVNYQKVMELNMASLIARVEDVEEMEIMLDRIFKEAARAGNIILVINDFHNYINQAGRPGMIDIGGIISYYLDLPQFQLIAITTYDGLHRNIEKQSSILSRLEKIEVSEISPRQTLMLVEMLVPELEQKHDVFVSYPAIREIINLTDRYFSSQPFPDKALDILDEVVIYTSRSTQDQFVLPKHVSKIITEKTEVPVGELKSKEKEILLNLENLIHQRIINQDEAVKEVSTALRRARSQITVREGPLGTFLFMGPTGVGKTETSKALAHFYFGSEDRMIRMDMSEFQNVEDIARLIGSEKQEGVLTTRVREDPFSLVLLDEIEKAHPNILNLFLQILDEGYVTDGVGRKVDFKNTMIVATSNAGYRVILNSLEKNINWEKTQTRLLDYLFDQGIFRPEFINRFDAVVLFSSLSKENLLDISGLMLAKLKKNMENKGIDFKITRSLKERIVELGYSPVFGAREMRRVIQENVENVLASALLEGDIRRGDTVMMDSNFSLKIKGR